MAILYKHIRESDNQVFYIGIGSSEKRAYIKSNRGSYWKRYVEKYSYKVEIVLTDLTWEDACKWEQYLIGLYGRKSNNKGSLINLTDGGEGRVGYIVPKDVIDKIRQKNIGKKVSIESRKRLSDALTGRKLSEFTKNKMKGRQNHRKKVIDISTNIIYDSLKLAADEFKLKETTLIAMLKGQNRNKTTLKYYTECH